MHDYMWTLMTLTAENGPETQLPWSGLGRGTEMVLGNLVFAQSSGALGVNQVAFVREAEGSGGHRASQTSVCP